MGAFCSASTSQAPPLCRRQYLTPVGLDYVAAVAPAADFQVRREQCEEPQLGEHRRCALQPRVNEHTGPVRIGDHFLDDSVLSLGIDIGDTVTQCARGQTFVGVIHLAFAAEKRFPIGNEILQVAYLRPINGRVVNLVQDSLGDGKPDPAQRRVSGPYSVLVAARPGAGRSQDCRWPDGRLTGLA